MTTLISDAELNALRGIAESGMRDAVATVLARSSVETDDGQETVWATSGPTVNGWIYEVTATSAVIGVIAGQLGLAEVSHFRAPVNTVIHSGDHLLIDGITYTVEHTNEESTYKVWLDCAVRALAE